MITDQVAEYGEWGIEQIRDRKAEMAELAVKTWSLSFD
jgi:hypothetical protein